MASRVVFLIALFAVHVAAASPETPERVLTFEFASGAPSDARLTSNNTMGRPALLFGTDSPGVNFRIDPDVGPAFTVAAWVRLDRYPNGGERGFTDTNPATIVHLKGDGEAILRVDGRRLQFVTNGSGDWRSVTSGPSLPLHEWVLVAGGWARGELAVYIDGLLVASRHLDGVELSLDHLTVGRSRDRVFVGAIDEVRVFAGAPGMGWFRELMRSRGHELGASVLRDWRATPAVVPYPSLKVTPRTLHPLAEGVATRIELLPWSSPQSLDLLVGGLPNFFGFRQTIHRRVGTDDRGLPVYSPGESAPLRGMGFRAVPRPDGLTDLMAYGRGTPVGGGNLILYRNIGESGAPQFDSPRVVTVDGHTLTRALDCSPGAWSLHDFDADSVPDLLISGGSGMTDNYWPGGVSPWNGQPYPNSGPGRGYDIVGNWLGESAITRLFWIPGSRGENGELNFGRPRQVYVGDMDYQVQWRFYSPLMVPAVLHLDDADYIVLAGATDQIVALPFTFDGQDVRCGPARPLLREGAPLHDVYWPTSIVTADITGDGAPEVVVSGNPGRVVVLQGRRVGDFVEVGSLLMRGGELEVDTLVTPARGQWDDDNYPDLICGDASGWLTYWSGTDDPLVYGEPVFLRTPDGARVHHQAGPTGSIQGPNERRWGYLQPGLGDWDNDGRPDLITNDIRGRIVLYRRTGSPEVVDPEPFTMNGEPLPAAWRARPAVLPGEVGYAGDNRPALLYLDWGGDLALGVPNRVGGTRIVRSDKLYYSDGEPVRLSGVRGHWGRAKLSIADWDGDGRWDVVWGQNAGTHRYIWQENPPDGATPAWLRNVGTNREPVFDRLREIRSADGERLDFGIHNASVWPTDLNGDGELDLLVGAEDGKVYYFYRDDLSEGRAPAAASP